MADLSGDGFSEIVTERRIDRGHNQPPGLLPADLVAAHLRDESAELLKKAADLIASEARIPKDADGNLLCADEDTERKMTTTVRTIQSIHDQLDAARVAAVRPYDEARDVAHGLFREVMDALVVPDSKLKKRGVYAFKERLENALGAFKDKREEEERQRRLEEARKRQQEADAAEAAAARAAEKARGPVTQARAEEAVERAQEAREAADQAQAMASVPTTELTRARGTVGVSTRREFVDFKDIDRDKIDLKALRPYLPMEALEKAVTALIRANKQAIEDELRAGKQRLKGVTFFMNRQTKVSG